MPVKKASINDAPQIHQLINQFARDGEMLARPLSEIYENIRDFFIVLDGEQVVACGALHINWADLAEVKSLAVHKDYQRRGLGKLIVEACRQEAKELGIERVFCLTRQPDFFEGCAFHLIDRAELPQKVWGEVLPLSQVPQLRRSSADLPHGGLNLGKDFVEPLRL